jgi:hypothetical protein
MKGKLLWSIFWALVAVFLLVIGMIFFGMPLSGYILFGGMIALFGLGVTLIVLTVRKKVKGMLKAFLLLTGAAAIGIPASFLLHNLVYALFIRLFGEGFWGSMGDEPFFLVMTVLVCPIAFLVGGVGSVFFGLKKSAPRRRKR